MLQITVALQIMYLQFSWRVLRAPCQIRNVQFTSRIYSSQNVLTKPQVTKLDSSIQEKSEKVITLKDDDFLRVDEKTVPLVADLLVKKLNDVKETTSANKKWKELQLDTSKLGNFYLKLSKYRLTSLVVMTSMIGYAMSPAPFDIISFFSCVVGTGLVSSAANSVNQFLEVPFDAQMSRTRNRVLVQGQLTPLHAIGFATAAGSVGLLILCQGANALTATLGASNLVLYTLIYTPLKRISIVNTWVGSIVGAIPPLMGWAACQGTLDPGAFILGGILYAWQFPHFNALSWNLRPDYSKAGYRMMAVTDPGLCRRTALRYTLGITAFSSLAPILNVTHWSFGVLSLPINLYFVYLGFKFFKNSDSRSSRKLFRFSLLHLPLLMGLMLVTKQGLFSSFFQSNATKNEELLLINTSEDGSNTLIRQLNPSETKKFTGSQVFHMSV